MYYEGRTTSIPSQVLRLPSPLLEPSSSWAAVQPSPDRTSVLLRGRHECRLLRLSPAQGFLNHAQNSNCNGAGVVLPQPHRRLTASCWVSSGADETAEQTNAHKTSSGISDNDKPQRDRMRGAVVALGDNQSAVSLVRASHSSEVESTGEWSQSTIFLHDAHARLFGTETCTSHLACATRPLSRTPAYKAVQTIIACQLTSASSSMTDAHLICRRRDEGPYNEYDGAARASSRVTTHGVWMASAQRESAWMVPLTMPEEDGEEEEEKEQGRSNAAVGHGADSNFHSHANALQSRHTTAQVCRRGLRLFNVHSRVAPLSSSLSSFAKVRQDAGLLAGRVFAAASRRHVGLFTTTTVKPTVFFDLPNELPSYDASASLDIKHQRSAFSPLALSSRDQKKKNSWAVTSVLEAPPPALAAQMGCSVASPASASGNGYSYLITVSRPCYSAQPPKTADLESWWLLYDCRKPSVPVWAVEAPRIPWSTAPLFTAHQRSCVQRCDDACSGAQRSMREGEDVFCLHDDGDTASAVLTEWLCSATPTAVSAPSLLCASYLPGTRSPVKEEERPFSATQSAAAFSAAGVCVVLEGGCGALPEAATEETGVGRMTATPIVHALSPPASLSVQKGEICHVRALSYRDNVLSYLCTCD